MSYHMLPFTGESRQSTFGAVSYLRTPEVKIILNNHIHSLLNHWVFHVGIEESILSFTTRMAEKGNNALQCDYLAPLRL